MFARLLAVLIAWSAFPVHQAQGSEAVASWYQCCNAETTSGVRFSAANPHIAAHKTLPFGSRRLVTNRKNHKQLCVSVEDRGPFAAGVSYDLTLAGAKALDFVRAGHAKLRVEDVWCYIDPKYLR